MIFATGEGQTNPGGEDGKLALLEYPQPLGEVKVLIGGKEAKVWEIMAPTNGITLKVGDRFKVRSSSLIFTVKGWNTRSPKFPIQAEAGGKSYKLGVSTVKFAEKV